MKKLILIPGFLICLFLCSCSQKSPYCNLTVFSDTVNDVFNEEIISGDNTFVTVNDTKKTVYCVPDNYSDICISLYPEDKSGNIKQYNLVFNSGKSSADTEFIKKFTYAVKNNNKYIEIKEFETDDCYLIKYTDRRYDVTQTGPTLKKKINESDLY